MPRVHFVHARAAKKERRCARCGEPIEVGQAVYKWTRRNWPTAYQHQGCGYPRPSQLSSRKTAVIEDILHDVDWSFTETLDENASPGDTHEIDTSHVQQLLEEVADAAEEVGSEYSGNADALPEGLQYGSQAEAMRDVGQNLEQWASDMRYHTFDDTTVDLRELEENETPDEWRVAMQEEIDDACNRISEEAEELTQDMPEYEG